MNYMHTLSFLAVAVFTVTGQLLVKMALTKYGTIPETFVEKAAYLARVLLDPLIILGFGSAFAASLVWLAIMSRFDLSFAYPYMIACLTLATAISGYMFLNESITRTSLIGTAFIIAGVLLMSVKQ